MSEASHWWERRPEAAGALGALGMGLLFGTGFDPLGWQWMSLIALVGFFLVFAARPTPARAALVGFLFGLGWFVPGLSWTMNSIAVYGRLPWAVAALALFVLGAVLSLFPAFACWIAKKIGGGRLATELPALAGVWTLAEWLRGDALANFGWLMPGYAVIDTPLAGWAPLGGIYAVTLAQLLFAALVAVALSCRLAWLAVPVIGAALIAGTGQVSRQHAWSEPSSTVDVRIIQPALPVVDAYTRANPAQRIEALFPAAFKPWPASDRPRLLLTPEGIVNVPVSRLGREAAGRLVLLQEKTEARVLFNGFRKDGPRFFNTSFVLDEGQIAYRLDKRELVPFGEYVPAGFHWFVEMIGIPMSDLMRGDAVQPLLSLGGADAGILICYENLYGSVVRTFWQSRSPDFLIVTSNLGWFGRSVLGQHLTMSRMRAMESARPLVSVSNTGMSALVNSRGEIAAMLRTDGPDAATMPLLGATGSPTPYVRLGNWPALLASLVLALCAVLVRLGTARIRAGKVKGL